MDWWNPMLLYATHIPFSDIMTDSVYSENVSRYESTTSNLSSGGSGIPYARYYILFS